MANFVEGLLFINQKSAIFLVNGPLFEKVADLVPTLHKVIIA